jgi:uncharacterized protein with NRDE domain
MNFNCNVKGQDADLIQEYLHRPTSSLHWWRDPNSHVLASRDLARPEQGTWMGITKQGRIAVLTNYREEQSHAAIGTCSRGAIVNGFLTLPPQTRAPSTSSKLTPSKSTLDFCANMIESQTARNAGGFSLVCGYFDEPLSIISNRMSDVEGVHSIAQQKGETIGLSNTFITDRSWPKILDGERLVEAAVAAHVKAGETENEDDLIQRLLEVLNRDTLPRLEPLDTTSPNVDVDDYVHLFQQSIFVPVIGGGGSKNDHHDRPPVTSLTSNGHEATNYTNPKHSTSASSIGPNPEPTSNMPLAQHTSGPYGTQKQTVWLITDTGRVRYFERTLYDNDAVSIPLGKGDHDVEFMIE